MFAENLFLIDTKTAMVIVFWYNLVAIITNMIYWATARDRSKFDVLKNFTLAKLFVAMSFFLMIYRGIFPDLLSFNVANSLLHLGFYTEMLAIFNIFGIKQKRTSLYLMVTLCLSVIFYNTAVFLNQPPNIRIAVTSFCIFMILLIPSFSLLFARKSNTFVRVLGLFYLLFTFMMLPRGIYMLNHANVTIFTNSFPQSLTFLSLILVSILGNSVFLLMMKENADRANVKLACTDFLTKLSNRYNFLSHAEQIFESHKQNGSSLAVLFFDLDKFKAVNDQYGHMFGDTVLVRFSDILRNHLRECDLACRYGGEEFVVLLPHADQTAGLAFAEAMLHEVSQTKFDAFPDFRLTTSIGLISRAPVESDVLSTYLEAADKMLYQAKENGRNRIEISL